MPSPNEDIIKKIEKLREELNEAGNNIGLLDHKVLKVSQKLDKLINRYYELQERYVK